MAKKKTQGSTKRFGPRYGGTIKNKLAQIEELQRKKHKCPECKNIQVKRIAAGIWQCKKCNVKFAGKAYLPAA